MVLVEKKEKTLKDSLVDISPQAAEHQQ